MWSKNGKVKQREAKKNETQEMSVRRQIAEKDLAHVGVLSFPAESPVSGTLREEQK